MLKFSRNAAGRYQADSDSRRYVVAKYGRGWLITVLALAETSGIRHTIGQPAEATSEADTKTLAVDIANRYETLASAGTYEGSLRMIRRATVDAYTAENARIRAEIDGLASKGS